ncbi:hypothetical protein [Kiloniella antarctica]|uniref:DUF2946 domain-containing protein n=1 Tax=Kiloniella antarctica TaxID=1550907 RepID=A0ABW5BIY5_9PROT
MPVLFWLIAQLLMTGIVTPVSALNIDSQVQSSQITQVIICTPTGLKLVNLTQDSSPNDPSSETDVPCKWCVGFAKTVLPTSPQINSLYRQQVASPLKWYISSDTATIPDLQRFSHIRAPPFNSKMS